MPIIDLTEFVGNRGCIEGAESLASIMADCVPFRTAKEVKNGLVSLATTSGLPSNACTVPKGEDVSQLPDWNDIDEKQYDDSALFDDEIPDIVQCLDLLSTHVKGRATQSTFILIQTLLMLDPIWVMQSPLMPLLQSILPGILKSLKLDGARLMSVLIPMKCEELQSAARYLWHTSMDGLEEKWEALGNWRYFLVEPDSDNIIEDAIIRLASIWFLADPQASVPNWDPPPTNKERHGNQIYVRSPIARIYQESRQIRVLLLRCHLGH
eukprot:GHVO01042281.1.p1 GENE.GHVO01042281.1~~GHVO01042281.1.p1  ORF type:complete len:267 (-),score=56.87 GHVO01042281.1:409-1209(-)